MTGPAPAWERLFEQALRILEQTQAKFEIDIFWSLGGGTALMLQIDHRESFDVDMFVDDPQVMPLLNASTQGYELDIAPTAYQTDGIRTLKLVFAELGEIDFICTPALTEDPISIRQLCGTRVRLETPAEIIAKKIVHRGASLQPRDMFDLACVLRSHGKEYLYDRLRPFRHKAGLALSVAEAMDPLFARTVMMRLIRRERFADICDTAQEATIDLLDSVCREK